MVVRGELYSGTSCRTRRTTTLGTSGRGELGKRSESGGGSVTAEGRGELAQLVSNQVMVIADGDDKDDGDESDDGHKQGKSLFA